MLDIVEPMDMVQMSYRVSQIEQKYNRSLSGLIIVDTYQTNDDIIPVSEWKKQKTLKKKLMAASQNDTELMSMQDRDALFHMNTHQKFDIYNMHSTYQHVFQGPYRLIQVCDLYFLMFLYFFKFESLSSQDLTFFKSIYLLIGLT